MRYRRLRQSGATYFFTLVTGNRMPLFADDRNVALLRDVTKSVQIQHPFAIEAQVVLPDHLHALWSLPNGDDDFTTRWMLIKAGFSRIFRRETLSGFASGLTPTYDYDKLRRANRGERSIWQQRFWEHLIRDDEDFANHIEYIHYNPVKHGLAKSPIDWPHSTFKSFVDQGLYEAHWGSNDMPPHPVWAGRE